MAWVRRKREREGAGRRGEGEGRINSVDTFCYVFFLFVCLFDVVL